MTIAHNKSDPGEVRIESYGDVGTEIVSTRRMTERESGELGRRETLCHCEDFGFDSGMRILLEDCDQERVHKGPLCFVGPIREQIKLLACPCGVGLRGQVRFFVSAPNTPDYIADRITCLPSVINR